MQEILPSLGLLKRIDDFDSLKEVRNVPPEQISETLLTAVRRLDEREELEPYLRLILHDPNQTPHGPAEIADIFTHKLSIQKLSGMAAFILKGKSFKTVRAQDVAHQIYRLEKIAGLAIAIFAASGTILDPAKEHFVSTALVLAATTRYLTPTISLDCLWPTVFCAREMDARSSRDGATVGTLRPKEF